MSSQPHPQICQGPSGPQKSLNMRQVGFYGLELLRILNEDVLELDFYFFVLSF